MGVRGLGAVIICLLLGSCAGGGGSATPLDTEDFEHVTLFGVSFGHPAGWQPCRIPGQVSPGPTVDVRPPDLAEGAAPPLTVQVSGKSIESWIEFDRTGLGLGPEPDVTVEPATVPGADDARRVTFRGAAFGFQYAAIAVYAAYDRNVVKVYWYGDPSDVGEGEAILDAVVAALDFEASGGDTPLPDCAPLRASTRPGDADLVPDEVAGTYETEISRRELRGSAILSATEHREWTMVLQGDELELTGTTGSSTTSLSFPILEASTTELVLEGNDCDDPQETMEMTLSFVTDGYFLNVADLEPVCDERVREILTINEWERVSLAWFD